MDEIANYYTSLTVIIMLIVSLFVLYRILVKTKDSQIDLLKEKISKLESNKLNPLELESTLFLLEKKYSLLIEDIKKKYEKEKQEELIMKRTILKEKESEIKKLKEESKTLRISTEKLNQKITKEIVNTLTADSFNMVTDPKTGERGIPIYHDGRIIYI